MGVIGITYPTDKEAYYVITNMAVKPSLKNKGLGSKIIKELINRTALKPKEYWVSFVDKENKNGRHFLEKNGWTKKSAIEDGMIRYEFRPHP